MLFETLEILFQFTLNNEDISASTAVSSIAKAISDWPCHRADVKLLARPFENEYYRWLPTPTLMKSLSAYRRGANIVRHFCER